MILLLSGEFPLTICLLFLCFSFCLIFRLSWWQRGIEPLAPYAWTWSAGKAWSASWSVFLQIKGEDERRKRSHRMIAQWEGGLSLALRSPGWEESNCYGSRPKPRTSVWTGLSQWPLLGQAWASDLCRSRPEAVTSTEPGLNQWPPLEQAKG